MVEKKIPENKPLTDEQPEEVTGGYSIGGTVSRSADRLSYCPN